MRKRLFPLALALIFCCSGIAAKEKHPRPVCELSCAGTADNGDCLALVSVYLPKPNKGVTEGLLAAAVYGMVFKGVEKGDICPGLRPLADKEGEHTAFFDSLLTDTSRLSQYASIVSGTIIVEKHGKKDYKISATMTIKKEALRKMLEEAKVTTGFGDLF